MLTDDVTMTNDVTSLNYHNLLDYGEQITPMTDCRQLSTPDIDFLSYPSDLETIQPAYVLPSLHPLIAESFVEVNNADRRCLIPADKRTAAVKGRVKQEPRRVSKRAGRKAADQEQQLMLTRFNSVSLLCPSIGLYTRITKKLFYTMA